MKSKTSISISKIVFLIMLSMFSNIAYSFDMPVNWSTWDDGAYIDHFKVYWGTSPENYTNESGSISNNVTSYTAQNLTDGEVYYFAVKAFDANGNESFFSNEVSSHNIVAPAAPQSLSVE